MRHNEWYTSGIRWCCCCTPMTESNEHNCLRDGENAVHEFTWIKMWRVRQQPTAMFHVPIEWQKYGLLPSPLHNRQPHIRIQWYYWHVFSLARLTFQSAVSVFAILDWICVWMCLCACVRVGRFVTAIEQLHFHTCKICHDKHTRSDRAYTERCHSDEGLSKSNYWVLKRSRSILRILNIDIQFAIQNVWSIRSAERRIFRIVIYFVLYSLC